MSPPIRLTDCDTVYHASVGGYWQAVKSFGAMLLLSVVALAFVAVAPLVFAAMTCISMVFLYRTVQTSMRQRNQKLGVCEHGLVARDWLYRVRYIPWGAIALVLEQPSSRGARAVRVLTVLTSNERDVARPIDVAFSAPTPLPETPDMFDTIRDEISRYHRSQ